MSSKSNVIAAKARAMYGKRLTAQNYAELLRFHTVAQVAGYLKGSLGYGSMLANINENEVHRGQLEAVLRRSTVQKLERLYRYHLQGGGVFDYFIMDMEIDLILHCVTALQSGEFEEMIAYLPIFVKEHTSFDIKKIGSVRTKEDLIGLLMTTQYRGVVDENLKEHHGDLDYSSLELSLRVYYYSSFLDFIAKEYKGKTREQLEYVIKMECDLYNMTLIYRLRHFFKYSGEQVKPLLLPFYCKLNPKKLALLLQAPSTKAVINSMTQLYSKKEAIPFDSDYIEGYAHRVAFVSDLKYLRFSSSPTVTFYTFMSLTKQEVNNLVTLIEGIRYQMVPEEMKQILVYKENS